MSCKEKKPEGIPTYYKNHGIAADPRNGWVCKDGLWIWTIQGIEKAQVEKYEREAEARAYTLPTRDMYGSIKYHGKQCIVWVDTKHGDYIAVDGVHYKLNPNWWTTHYKRTHGETQTKGVIPRKSMEEVMSEKRWGAPSLPSLKLPSIGLAGKGLIGIIVMIGVVILILVAIGYSGLGGAAGSHLEK